MTKQVQQSIIPTHVIGSTGTADTSDLGYRPLGDFSGDLAGVGMYRRANILGTVSQSGGVPTGAIIERGSNANGEFVKYADGTMICTLRFSGSLATTTAAGDVFRSGLTVVSLPATFVDTDFTVAQYVASRGMVAAEAFDRTRNTSSFRFYFFSWESDTQNRDVDFTVTGRWF